MPGREREPLLIRADASPSMGAGHVMRCLALAQAWQEAGGRVTFGMAMPAPELEARLQAEGMEVSHLSAPPGDPEDARQTLDLAHRQGAQWIVVDGYQFNDSYQRIIKDAVNKLLFIDDTGHAHHYCADIVLNQNLFANEGFYQKREPYTRLLLGTDYALLRREFLKWRNWPREIPQLGRKILVTLGGGDPNNVTLKVLGALAQVQMDGLEAVVVLGAANPHLRELQGAVANLPHRASLKSNVADMADLMAWADLAITAGGSTSWELAFMGLPSLILVLAPNQAPVAESLEERGIAIHAGWAHSLSQIRLPQLLTTLIRDREKRLKMSHEGRLLVNGSGSQNVVKAMLN